MTVAEPALQDGRVCRFPGCDRPAMPAEPGVGRPPVYCDEPGHNRAAAWRARQRIAAGENEHPQPAGESARPVDAARGRAGEIHAQVAAMAQTLTEQLQALLVELRTLADPGAAQAQIAAVTSEAEEKVAAATARAARAEQAARRAEAERAEADAAAGEATAAAQDLRGEVDAARARLTEAEASRAALAAELDRVRADAQRARRDAHEQQARLGRELVAHTARADAAEHAREETVAAAAKADQQARDAITRAETETARAARAETATGALREQLEQARTETAHLHAQLATRTAERDAARRDAEHEKTHGQQRAADLHTAYQSQIEALRRDLDHARAHTEPAPQAVASPPPAPAGPATSPAASATPAAGEGRATKPARRARPRWHVVQLDEAAAGDLDAVVVVMSTHASEKAAKNTMSRMRSKHTGRGRDDTVHYEVRRATDIRRRLEWDPETGRGVQRDGPPP